MQTNAAKWPHPSCHLVCSFHCIGSEGFIGVSSRCLWSEGSVEPHHSAFCTSLQHMQRSDTCSLIIPNLQVLLTGLASRIAGVWKLRSIKSQNERENETHWEWASVIPGEMKEGQKEFEDIWGSNRGTPVEWPTPSQTIWVGRIYHLQGHRHIQVLNAHKKHQSRRICPHAQKTRLTNQPTLHAWYHKGLRRNLSC